MVGKKKKAKVEFQSDQDLLTYLSSIKAKAWIPGGLDHDQGITPPWCELVLEISRKASNDAAPDFPLKERLPLRRHDGELIIEVLYSVLHPRSGFSIPTFMWTELDRVIDQLIDEPDKHVVKQLQGKAEGLTLAIAIMAKPYAYDVDEVRAVAMERREERERVRALGQETP